MFYTKKNDYPNFATMKKLVIISVLLMLAAISFGQTVPVQAKTFRITYGSDSYSINLNGDSILIDASDFIWFADKIGSDTLLFGDGTYMTTAFVSGVNDTGYVKTTGDTLWGTFNFEGSNSYLDNGTLFFYTSTGQLKGMYSQTEMQIGNATSSIRVLADRIYYLNGYTDINDVITLYKDTSIVDDGSRLITTDGGWGEVYAFNAGAIDEWAEFIISADGTVYLKSNSTDVVTTDTDGKLCIFDNGSGVTIRNRLGGIRTIKYIIHH